MKTTITGYITSLESGGRPKGGALTDGGIPSLGAEHLNSDGTLNLESLKYIPLSFYENLNKGRINKNDILIVKDGATTGKVSFVNGVFPYKDAAINEHVFLLRVDEKKLYSKYLFYHLYSDFGKNQILSDFRGSTVGGISRGFVEYINLPLPDLKTQKEIAHVLEQADKARQQRKAANGLTDQFLQSSFLSLFGDPVKNEKGWEMKKIGDFTPNILSGKSVQSESRLKEEDEYGVLKVSAVTYGIFKPKEHKAIINGFKPNDSITPKKGDILFSRANTKELVAATCIVDKDYPDLFLPDKLWKVNIDRTIVNEWFFKYVLSQQSYRNKLSEKATGTSGSMFNISKEKLIDFNFPIPPLSLQQQFAGIVAQAEQLRQKQRESERELENLFQGLLQRYFG